MSCQICLISNMTNFNDKKPNDEEKNQKFIFFKMDLLTMDNPNSFQFYLSCFKLMEKPK